MDAELRLIEPFEAMRDEFIAYCEELRDAGEPIDEFIADREEFRDAGEPVPADDLSGARTDFSLVVKRWADAALGKGPREGIVPWHTYWLVRGGRILGTARLRHRLTKGLTHEGGHVGYEVRPNERGRGHATRLLAMVLEKAREMGLKRVLLTCDKDNAASARVIRKNGGVLDSEVVSQRSGKPVQRYWITL